MTAQESESNFLRRLNDAPGQSSLRVRAIRVFVQLEMAMISHCQLAGNKIVRNHLHSYES